MIPTLELTEALLRYLWMNAAGEQMRRMRAPQIVERDVRQAAGLLAERRTNSCVRLFGCNG